MIAALCGAAIIAPQKILTVIQIPITGTLKESKWESSDRI